MLKINTLSSITTSITLLTIGLSIGQANAASLNSTKNSILPSQIKTIANNLTVPYEIITDNSDLVVTTDGALVKIDSSGATNTIAKTTPGSPGGVVLLNNQYIVADYPSESLLNISRDGKVKTLATDLHFPVGIATQGNDVIVVDTGVPEVESGQVGNGRLLRVSLDGKVSTIASKNIGAPIGVAVKDDKFWVADYALGRLLSVSLKGEVRTVASNLGQPLDIEPDGEDFIITDFADGFRNPGHGRILRVSRTGEVETLLTGGNPSAMTIKGSDLVVSDVMAGTINRISGIVNQKPRSVPEPSVLPSLLFFGSFYLIFLFKRRIKQPVKNNC